MFDDHPPSRGVGDNFKLLGPTFDAQLSMQPCLENVLRKIRPKIRALLRVRHMYNVATIFFLSTGARTLRVAASVRANYRCTCTSV